MLKLPKRKTLTEWIKISDESKIKVDYPKGQQIHELQNIMADGEGKNSSFYDYARLYLKYTVKDWDNLISMEDEKGKDVPVKCELKDNELTDDVWYLLTSDGEITITLFNKIDDELRWVNKDKKK